MRIRVPWQIIVARRQLLHWLKSNSKWKPMLRAQAPATLPTGGIKTAFHTSGEPEAKKAKVPSVTTSPLAKSALSDRLGFTMPGTQASAPQQQQLQQQQHVQQQQQQQVPMPMPPQPHVVPSKPPTAAAPPPGGLPVGVGIRLGGVGGVAPATAQLAPAAQANQFIMWGGMNAAGGTGMSEQAIAERRQRNREHAKRSRVRKKFMLESLQEQVKELQRENVQLRMIVQQKIPAHAQQIITECCSANTLFSDPNNGQDGEKKTGRNVSSQVRLYAHGESNIWPTELCAFGSEVTGQSHCVCESWLL